ncbi:MAG TPA: hypothetical protein VNI84_09025 [Pyrinomonadaceae bacterium]|nr:hypothetical protein [Pyrinomonadaceae bacterium]
MIFRLARKFAFRWITKSTPKFPASTTPFTATLTEPLIVRDVLVLPAGTVIEGRVLKVQTASVGGKHGRLIVSFETMRLANGVRRQIEGVPVKDLEADSSPKVKAITIAGAAALGGIIGAVSKTQNGALIGAGIGAGAGASFALLRKGENVGIKADEKFEIKLVKNVILPPPDF